MNKMNEAELRYNALFFTALKVILLYLFYYFDYWKGVGFYRLRIEMYTLEGEEVLFLLLLALCGVMIIPAVFNKLVFHLVFIFGCALDTVYLSGRIDAMWGKPTMFEAILSDTVFLIGLLVLIPYIRYYRFIVMNRRKKKEDA